jgi:hypothetical protein
MENRCGPGEILRKGYYRKPYFRGATYVHGTYVPPSCIPDRGRPGRGPEILPKPDKRFHLSSFGYNIHLNRQKRWEALKEASQRLGNPKPVLQRLNLIRNLQGDPKVRKIFDTDVEFMKRFYRVFKYKHQRGGNPEEGYECSEGH